ncbi:MAG: anaerobic ribonucleoside-triphosphate reductase activating protein [Patescibacteria group bacterium]
MTIAGIQRLSLLDYPGRPCGIVFTQGCLLRCGYCHNPDLIPLPSEGDEVKGHPSKDEAIAFLERGKKVVDAVCITGGEPTIQPGLTAFIRELKARGFVVKLDTNGVRPDVVRTFLEEKLLDYIAMDLKAPWEKVVNVIRVANPLLVENMKKTFSLIQESGVPHEFRTTIAPGVHTADDFTVMARYLKDGERYAIQQTRFEKNLNPDITRDIPFSAWSVVDELKIRYPQISFSSR